MLKGGVCNLNKSFRRGFDIACTSKSKTKTKIMSFRSFVWYKNISSAFCFLSWLDYVCVWVFACFSSSLWFCSIFQQCSLFIHGNDVCVHTQKKTNIHKNDAWSKYSKFTIVKCEESKERGGGWGVNAIKTWIYIKNESAFRIVVSWMLSTQKCTHIANVCHKQRQNA